LDEVYLKIDGRMAYASGFRDKRAHARAADDGGKTKNLGTPGRLGGARPR
jgi:hypothetical protein